MLKTHQFECAESTLFLLDEWHPQDAQHEGHVLEDRHGADQLEVLEHDSQLAPQVGDLLGGHGGQPVPCHHDLARAGHLLPEDQFKECGFTRPRRPGEEDELAGFDGEAHIRQRDVDAIVLLADVSEGDHRIRLNRE